MRLPAQKQVWYWGGALAVLLLALWALGKVYDKDIVFSGPLYRSRGVKGGSVVIDFEHTGSGLATRDGMPPASFEVAGRDGVFRPASARIEGDTVVVSGKGVASPVNVRYGWAPVPECNLVNRDGLPASPFTSED